MKFIKFDYTPFPSTVTLEGVKWRLETTGRRPLRADQIGKQDLVKGSISVCLGGNEPIAISTDGRLMSLEHGWNEIADNQWLYPVEDSTKQNNPPTLKLRGASKKEKQKKDKA